ncbi:MAG: histidine phosphotransferase family protein [Paracoccaceae bacterium]
MFNGSRVYVSWCIETSIKRIEAQAIFLSIMCLETSMPLGGEIHIGRQKDKTLVKGSSPNFSIIQSFGTAYCSLLIGTILRLHRLISCCYL